VRFALSELDDIKVRSTELYKHTLSDMRYFFALLPMESRRSNKSAQHRSKYTRSHRRVYEKETSATCCTCMVGPNPGWHWPGENL
jgi:hypothetical protein